MRERMKRLFITSACTLGLFTAFDQSVRADDCLFMKASTLVNGELGSWKIGGFEPGDHFVIVWGTKLGSTPVKGALDYCANFGIAGVNAKRILGQGQADSSGVGLMDRQIPKGTAGITVYTQAAKRGTCPDECTSNIVESLIQ